jgi:ubiquinone/menaquinone biosynthesis C-methylase UbiE
LSIDRKLGLIWFLREVRTVIRKLIGFRTSLTETNRTSYNSLIRVEAYTGVVDLKKPEQTILNLLKAQAPFKRMLDIGVGAGRTTPYFAEIAEEYIGIDYSENMIKHCRQKFQNYPKASFAVVDARNLSRYKDHCFDFVLFSHGGLDAVEQEDRIRILHEIQRVTREGGYFSFSTSNLDAMLQYCQIRLSKHPKAFTKELIRILMIRLLNSDMWIHVRAKQSNLEHTMFNVGGDNWSIKTYCITPKAQINQLKEAGFNNIHIYDLQGQETHATNITDVELYFLCNINEP